ncbi:MAG: hypothetical protein KF819_23090 [Labilithrix sp.]|nr:hypothetical protein [Labilithrix sp.]
MKRVAWVVTGACALVVVSPIARERGWDDFPISSYPMFSRGDLGDVVALSHVVVEHDDGTRAPAPTESIGTPEPMVAKGIVEGAVARGEAAALCARIARRIADGSPRRPRAIEVVTSTFDVQAYFTSGREPRERQVHARCEVSR